MGGVIAARWLNPYRVTNGHAGPGCRIVITTATARAAWRLHCRRVAGAAGGSVAAYLAMQPRVRRAYYNYA